MREREVSAPGALTMCKHHLHLQYIRPLGWNTFIIHHEFFNIINILQKQLTKGIWLMLTKQVVVLDHAKNDGVLYIRYSNTGQMFEHTSKAGRTLLISL